MKDDAINKLVSFIGEFISNGFTLDADIIRFIESTYGINETSDIIDLLENNSDEAILSMLSYPPENFREQIEEFIPLAGLPLSDIKKIEDSVNALTPELFVFFNKINKKIILSKNDSFFCCKRFIQKLYLNLPLDFISNTKTVGNGLNLSAIKVLLRKKKFSSNDDCCDFLNNLISNLQMENNTDEEYLKLIDLASDLFNGADENPFDILAEKKDFYIKSLLEHDEFNNLLKSYSMEFIMAKKIIVPIIPADELIYMINSINKMTRIVYK